MSGFFSGLIHLVRQSACWRFLSRPEKLSALYHSSNAGKILSFPFDACSGLLKRFGRFLERKFPESFTLWTLQWLGDRFYLFFYLFLAAHTIVPYSLYRNPYTVMAMILFVISFSLRVAFNKDSTFSAKRLDPVFILYFLSITLSAVFSLFGAGSGSASTTTAVLYITALLFPILISNAFTVQKKLVALVRALSYSTVVMSLYGIYQFFVGVPVDTTQVDLTTGGASQSMGRVYSTAGNPNILAAWLLLSIPLGVALFFMANGFRKKLLHALLVFPQFLCLLLTLSRSGWIGIFVAAVVFLFFLDWRIIPVFVFLGILSIPFIPQFIIDRFMTIGTDTSSVYRLSIWAGSFRMAQANPFTGIGIGLEFFKRFINNYVYTPYDQAPVHAHMLPLQIWVESGLCAVLAFLWMILRNMKKGALFISAHSKKTMVRYADADTSPQGLKMILSGCIAAFCGFLTMGLFEYSWFFPRCMNMFFIVFGVFISAINIGSMNTGSVTEERRC